MKLREVEEKSNLAWPSTTKIVSLIWPPTAFYFKIDRPQKTKKAWILSGPFPALKPIKPIVDIQFMNTVEK
jgi:hypothetical protein